MNKNLTRTRKSERKWPIGLVILLIIIGVVFGWLWHSTHNDASTGTVAFSSDGINYKPPTDAQKNAAGINNSKVSTPPSDSNEDNGGSNNNTGSTNTTPKKNVEVTITTWEQRDGNITVNGYADVIETGGTCTLTLVKDGQTQTATRTAHVNATNTTCGETSIPVSSLSPGTWQATLSYASSTSSGVSNKVPVEVK